MYFLFKTVEKLNLFLNYKKFKILFFTFVLLLVFLFLGSYLNPFDSRMFNFHDETQAGRIHDFVLNLKNGNIPPRIAPNFSFNLGMPVFNFYAPTAYWITSFFNLLGIPIVNSLKLSFLLTLFLSFIGMFLFLRLLFSYYSSLLGAVLYVSSTYFATEIFIRGNLAESWFLALLPFALYFMNLNSKKSNRIVFLLTVTTLSLLITTHNVLSLVVVSIILLGLFFLPNKRINVVALIFALTLGSYFLIPAIAELNLTRATETAKQFDYKDHFLCPIQIWSSPWNYGGSLPGCDSDLMSFKLGKIQITLGAFGIFLFLFNILQNYKKHKKVEINSVLIFLTTTISLFLTTYHSEIVWQILEDILSLFQFPWRFLVFGMFGFAFFSAYFADFINKNIRVFFCIFIIILSLYSSRNYFTKPLMEEAEYKKGYLNESYLNLAIAYNIREYLPKNIDYEYWHQLNPLEVNKKEIGFDFTSPVETTARHKIEQNDKFYKKISTTENGTFILNVHYFPYWKIYINNNEILPTQFDPLHRPIIKIDKNTIIEIKYQQTPIQILSNIFSIASALFLSIFIYYFKHRNHTK